MTKCCRAAVCFAFLLVPTTLTAQSNYREIFAFSDITGTPKGALIQARSGYLYGTASRGGPAGRGSVFRMTVDGTFSTVAMLQGATGEFPDAGLLEASDGNFYGTASRGGASGFGTIFKVSQAGAISVVASFTGVNGKFPEAELIEAADGSLLGTTSTGGANDLGTIFRVTTSGALDTLASFSGVNGSHPYARLRLASDGNYYGTTRDGGTSDLGTVFKLTPAGVLTTVASFAGLNGARPYAGLIQGADGALYGTTLNGGASYGQTSNGQPIDAGTVFKVTTAGAITSLTTFQGAGGYPYAGLSQGANGYLYGVTSGGTSNSGGTVFAVNAAGSVIAFGRALSQTGQQTGFDAQGELVVASNGYLYGTTSRGQVTAASGVVFRILPFDQQGGFGGDGFSVLFVFGISDARFPYAGVIQGTDGNLYGTTRGSGFVDSAAIFKVTPAGTFDFLASFRAILLIFPEAEIVQARDGSLYGTTAGGGTYDTSGFFKATTSGQVSKLFNFSQSGAHAPSDLVEAADGSFLGVLRQGGSCFSTTAACFPFGQPLPTEPTGIVRITPSGQYSKVLAPGVTYGGLLDGGDGFFYGTTTNGGSANRGVVFKTTSSGVVTSIAEFTIADGSGAAGGLVRGPDGAFYGTTMGGGPGNAPTLYRVTTAGVFTTLGTFTGGTASRSRLVLHTDGNFYGTTSSGGANNLGTVFRVTPAGSFSTVFSFNGTNGAYPQGALISARDGNLYGTASEGCAFNSGCVFRLSGPDATLTPASLQFGAVSTGASFKYQTGSQTIRIGQSGEGTFSWTATPSQPWIVVSPTSGNGPATATVSVAFAPGLPTFGSATGQVAFAFSGAGTAPPPIPVTLQLRTEGSTQPSFGLVDTPGEGTTGLTGAVPITGWALDDVEVAAVRLCRGAASGETVPADPRCGANQIFVGNATFVEGARPDVFATFPTYPRATRAGWGLLVLTNVLPGGGNGSYTFFAYAVDREGNVALLAQRTFSCDNAHATTPFGTIDTPGQGDTVSGNVTNFGWVLSPGAARADGAGGGTVDVTIDGVRVGSPAGWTSRSDLTTLFPQAQYSGVNKALGVFTFDSRAYADGVHTIGWSVVDTLGRAAGVGSRFFAIANGTSAPTTAAQTATSVRRVDDGTPVLARRGFDANAPLEPLGRSTGPGVALSAEEIERIELHLGDGAGRWSGHVESPAGLAPLPIGSVLDAESGVFTWQPGAGFVGSYDLTFSDAASGRARQVRITLYPKGSLRRGGRVVVDTPGATATVESGFVIAGWAVDTRALAGTGIDVVHVWAYPAGGASPIFLGAAEYGGARPDVARMFGAGTEPSGYGLVVSGLAPGTYDLAVFARSTVDGHFLPASVVRVTVR